VKCRIRQGAKLVGSKSCKGNPRTSRNLSNGGRAGAGEV
jgi:hypothetical protein